MNRAETTAVTAIGVLATVAVVGLLFLGPVGWILVMALVLGTFVLPEYSGSFDSVTAAERPDCPHGGAPNSLDRETCGHCERALTGD
ncbi:hypothetical protein [Haloarcula marina]|uniref:hypothetical protein n=1 Tax=Haloarcula marina TaxID=2961574 RepID=UPI0020B67CCC|nr:hypothetical protein [Halomicroarcula marina]